MHFIKVSEKVVPSQGQIVNSNSTQGKCVIIVLVAIFPLEGSCVFMVHAYYSSGGLAH